jgi:hypothetical protein
VRDLPLGRPRRENQRPATTAMQRKFRLLREAAYDEGLDSFDSLAADPSFRDFVCKYVGEVDPTAVAVYGVLTVLTSDTQLRARLQGWMDCLQAQWLHSPRSGA